MSFAHVHCTVAFSVTWAVTGSPDTGGLLALVEPAINSLAFYLHEQAWHAVGTRRTAAAE